MRHPAPDLGHDIHHQAIRQGLVCFKIDLPGLLDIKNIWIPSREQLIRDSEHLRQKWETEYYFFGRGRVDLCELESFLGMKTGRSLLECEQRHLLGRALEVVFRDLFKKVEGRMQDKFSTILAENDKIRDTFYELIAMQDSNSLPDVHKTLSFLYRIKE